LLKNAVSSIKKFVARKMRTRDVRIDTKLNKFVWAKGNEKVPVRIRLRMQRKRTKREEAREKMFTVVTWVPCRDFHFLHDEVVKDKV